MSKLNSQRSAKRASGRVPTPRRHGQLTLAPVSCRPHRRQTWHSHAPQHCGGIWTWASITGSPRHSQPNPQDMSPLQTTTHGKLKRPNSVEELIFLSHQRWYISPPRHAVPSNSTALLQTSLVNLNKLFWKM